VRAANMVKQSESRVNQPLAVVKLHGQYSLLSAYLKMFRVNPCFRRKMQVFAAILAGN